MKFALLLCVLLFQDPTAEDIEAAKAAAAKGDAAEQYKLACWLRDGKGIARNPAESFKWFNAAAKQGLAPAMMDLGICYERGFGVGFHHENAKSWYQRAAKAGSPEAATAFEAFSKAQPFFDEGYKKDTTEEDNAAAVAAYTKAIEAKPDFFLALNNRASCRFDMKEYADALKGYNETLSLNPVYYPALCLRGRTRLKISTSVKSHNEARADFTAAIASDPGKDDAWNQRASSFWNSNKLAEAEQDYSEAIRLSPKSTYHFHNRGALRHEMKKYDEAFADLTKAIEFGPTEAISYWMRGRTLVEKKDAAALADFKKAVQLQPKDGRYWLALGDWHNENEQWTEAQAAWDKAKEFGKTEAESRTPKPPSEKTVAATTALADKGNTEAQLRMARWCFKGFGVPVDFKAATRWFSMAAAGGSAEGHYALGVMAEGSGDFEKARDRYEAAAKLSLKVANSALGLLEKVVPIYVSGREKMGQKDLEGAVKDFDAALAIKSDFVPARFSKCEVLLAKPNRTAVDNSIIRGLLLNCLELKPDHVDAMIKIARVYVDEKNGPSVLNYLNKAIQCDPSRSDAWKFRGEAHEDLKKYPEAIADFEKAISIKPDYIEAHLRLGSLQGRQGNHAKSIEVFSTVIKLNPELLDGWMFRGQVRYMAKLYGEAVADLTKAVEISPASAEAWLYLGEAHIYQGNVDDARKAWRKARAGGQVYAATRLFMLDPQGTTQPVKAADLANAPLKAPWRLAPADLNDAAFTSLGEFEGMARLRLDKDKLRSLSTKPFTVFSKLSGLKTLEIANWKNLSKADFEQIAKAPAVDSLSIHFCDIAEAGLEHLAGITSLKSLSLSGTKIGAKGVACIGAIQTLESLDLGAFNDKDLAPLAACKALKKLNLYGIALDPSSIESLAALPVLERLSVSTPTDEMLEKIAALPALVHLTLYSPTKVTAAGLAHLVKAAKLRRLEIAGSIGSTPAENYAAVAALEQVVDLDLSVEIPDAALADIAKMPSLTSLRFTGTKVTDAGYLHLEKCSRLTSLSIYNCQTSDYKSITGLKGLTRLNLRTCKKSPTAEQFAGLVNLRDLELWYVNDLNSIALAGLSALPLERLILEKNPLLADQALDPIVKIAGLKEFTLGAPLVSAAGLKKIAGLKDLKNLDVSGCRTDALTAAMPTIWAALPDCDFKQ